jgi:protein SCO1
MKAMPFHSPDNMSSASKSLKIAAIAALIIIPTILVYWLAQAQWVHQELPYLGNTETVDGKKMHHTVENIELVNYKGSNINLDSFKNKIIVANIFFATCPEVCPEMNQQIQVIAEEFSRFKNVVFLSVSIDPENDSVPVLKQYANRFNGAKLPNWYFCTGSRTEIYDWVLNDILLANEMRGKNFIHDDKVVIIDKNRHIRSILETRPPAETPANRKMTVKLELVKNIRDDIDNLLYEYRKQELDK